MNKEKDILIQQLISIRASIDAALILLSDASGEDPDSEAEQAGSADQPCPHPPKKRQDMSTMRRKIWQCQDCGHVHEEDKPKGGVTVE